ncbi:hypothetical protein DU508_21605 [Pedobacter chinensis]|uniref:Uncharacterized protein n=2 Tax=Pedobacter chinensis TaxID=2282421 RepID=A0A369PPV0_9SPHI|nr:hypothetical protein DU508_21605 [Pedobacter chinensis]
MLCFINSNVNFILLLTNIVANILLLIAAVYFALEAMRSQSKVVQAYVTGRADALEDVLRGFEKMAKDQPSAQAPEAPLKPEKFEPVNGC